MSVQSAPGRVVVDRDACMGSGNCAFWAPGVFDLDDDGIAVVVGEFGGPRRRGATGGRQLPDIGHPCRRGRHALTPRPVAPVP